MAKTQWMKDKIIPLIDLARNNTKNIYIFENNLIENLKDYNLAAGMGLFKHNRLERGDCLIDDIQQGGSYKYEQKGGNNLQDITLGILSWKSCKTLQNTLESYKNNGLLDLVNVFIYFQEIGDVEKKLADKYSVPYIGTPQNIGIQKGLIQMINNTNTKYFIFAENDFELIHNKDEVQKVFEDCIKLLENDDISVVKLRDNQNPGEPNYSKLIYENHYKDKENLQDFRYKLEALSYIDSPETVFPGKYTFINYNYKWYKTSSIDNQWSNNIFIAKTQWMKDKVIPLIDLTGNNIKDHYVLEHNLVDNLKDYNLAAGMGLFKHNRLERGDCLIDDIQQGGSSNYESKIHYITVSTEKNDKLQRLLDSAKQFNISIEVLGLEMNTTNLGHNNSAKFGMKLGLPLDYISKLDPNDIVLFTDAWDVIYIKGEKDIIDNYKSFNKPIVFGAEVYCWPDDNKSSEYTDTKDKYFKYLNSGLYIGTAGELRNYLENYKGGEDVDDQRFWTDIYLNNRDKIALDTENKIFLNTAGTDKNDFDFENSIFKFKKTSSSPSVIHSNSSDKTYLDLFIKTGGGISNKERVFVINLEEKKDRKEDMISKFKDTMFDLQFVDAIKNENGFLGCSLSIQKIIQKAKDENLKTVLFFEDDNKPLNNYEERWLITKEWLDNNLDKWDIFNGGARVREHYLDGVKLVQSLDKDVNLFQADLILNTNWIYVNSKAYDKILGWKLEDNPSIMCIDHFMGDKNYFTTLFIFPFLGLQENGETSTEKGLIRDYSQDEFERTNSMNVVLNKLKQKGGSSIAYIKKASGIDQRSKNKLTVELNSGLGNRLFQIYAGLGFAEKWNMDFYLPNINLQRGNHKPIDESFNEIKMLLPNLNILSEDEDISLYTTISEKEELVYNEDDNPNNNAILKGYFQTEKYFPTNPPKLMIPEPENSIIKGLTNIYFIHIRLGDYLTTFALDLLKYHKYCIDKINTVDSNAKYIVVSDDISKAKEYIETNFKLVNVLYDESNDRLTSLYYISKCNGGIGTNSSFSWFGAYSIINKNKDMIFFPKPWFKNFKKEVDIYPSWATIIDINNQTGGNLNSLKPQKFLSITRGYKKKNRRTRKKKHTKKQKGGDYKDDIYPDDELNCKYLSMFAIIKASKNIKNLYCVNFENDELNSFTIPSEPFVIFTYSDATAIDDNIEKSTEILNSPNLLHWYAQNLTKHDNPKLSIMPIGIDYHSTAEQKSGYEWMAPKETPVQQEKLLFDLQKVAKPLNQREKKLYCNFYISINRHPNRYGAKDRADALEQIPERLLINEKDKVLRADSWKKMSETAFVVSPHGNGLDCYRTWEALALGCIVIVKKSSIVPLYNNLPVLIVDNWSDINEELLDKTINDYTNKTFNLDSITYKYWIDKIKNSFT